MSDRFRKKRGSRSQIVKGKREAKVVKQISFGPQIQKNSLVLAQKVFFKMS